MKHTIDTKAIQKLAAMSPEVKVYLEKEFPDAFGIKPCSSIVPALTIPFHDKHKAKSGDWMIAKLNGYMVQFIRYIDNDVFIGQHVLMGKFKVDKFLGCQFRPATTEEIQRFIPNYKPE